MEGFAITVFLKLRSPWRSAAACGSLPVHKYFITRTSEPRVRLLSASLSPSASCVCLPAQRPLPLNPEGQLSRPGFQSPASVSWAWASFLGVSSLLPLRPPCFLLKAALGLRPCHELTELRFLLSAESTCPSGFERETPAPSPAGPDMLRCWSPGLGGWPRFSSG